MRNFLSTAHFATLLLATRLPNQWHNLPVLTMICQINRLAISNLLELRLQSSKHTSNRPSSAKIREDRHRAVPPSVTTTRYDSKRYQPCRSLLATEQYCTTCYATYLNYRRIQLFKSSSCKKACTAFMKSSD